MTDFTLERANEYIQSATNNVIDIYRPKYHFAAPIGWINDPNGFVYFKGEYHLFYQYFPYDAVWGPMHWGHAKSKDLVHWEHLPVALAPDHDFDRNGCFSGSAIVKEDTLWLMYTGNIHGENGAGRQVQNMAYSKDGIHFEKIGQNPVLDESKLPEGINPSDFRDPKIFEKEGRYYSVIAARHTDNVGCILLYGSDDLVNWEFESIFLKGTPEQGEMWECPDYFNLDGKDIILLSPMRVLRDDLSHHNINTTVVMSGQVDWDTKEFKLETFDEIDHGHDFYAPQTLEDDNGRRIMIAWMNTWGRRNVTKELDHQWAFSMTIPRQLQWNNHTLIQKPITQVFEQTLEMVKDVKQADIITLELQEDVDVELRYGCDEDYVLIVYDKQEKSVKLNRQGLNIQLSGEEKHSVVERGLRIKEDVLQQLTLFIDKNSIEIFVNNGSGSISSNIYFEELSKRDLKLIRGNIEFTYYAIK